MDRKISTLILKANRVLGSQLVEAGVVTLRDLDGANEVFIERIRDGELSRASLLKILVIDRKTLKEPALIEYQLENKGIGAISLSQYRIADEVLATANVEECLATWTIPIDLVADTYFLATAYYLSDVVREHWEERLKSPIVWFVSPLNEIEERLIEYRARAPQGDDESETASTPAS